MVGVPPGSGLRIKRRFIPSVKLQDINKQKLLASDQNMKLRLAVDCKL